LIVAAAALPLTAAAADANDPSADNNQANANPPDMQGPVILGDGFVYQGELRDGKPDGKGLKRWPTGDWVAGDFVQGTIEGSATVHYSEGVTLTGTFRRNAPWDAVEKNNEGAVVAEYRAGVRQVVTQGTTAASPAENGAPAPQQVHSSASVPAQSQ
jgi:hypothetical protein